MAGAENRPCPQISYRQQYRRCGKAACSRCAADGPGHGPYWYAFWWEGGRSRSRYLGKHAPPGTDAVPAPVRAEPEPAPQARSGDSLRVRTLGAFAVWRGETLIPPGAWTSQRAASLFKCLLSAPGHRLQREQAIELLWPESEPAAGAANLRTTIHLLRQVLDGPGATATHLRAQGTAFELTLGSGVQPDEGWLDADAFAHAVRAALAGHDGAACRAALARYTGDYLPDEPYAEWAAAPRAALRSQYLELLLHQAALAAGEGDLEEAEGCLRRVLALEPGHEDAAATLMALLAASGRRHEALQVYQAVATALEEELEVAPSAEIAALRARLLAQEAAPVAASVAPQQEDLAQRLTNLPMALTSFVGRVWEVTAVAEALAAARLVTLTGPGGCGKTRLALAAADRLVEEYPDGVWLVELAALADPALVPRAVAGALGVVEQPGRPVLESLRDFLQPRHLLLVLDNCEHLLGACAKLAGILLRSCARLRLLATSREGLAVAGEHTYRVPSLAVPDPEQLPELERLATYEAVQLFLQRAQARRSGVTLTAANAHAMAQICARLDGLPLAIELAAARVSALPIEAIAARLDDRFRLLTGGPRTALPRQQTLRATLDWSYGLLEEPERVLLRRLAVFAGGCTLESAEAVCGDGVVPREAVLDLLDGLERKSVVRMEWPAGVHAGSPARYRLLETVRQFAHEQLLAADELPQVSDRHLDWCVALGEEAEPHLVGPEQLVWLNRLEQEHDNLRAALRWTTAHERRAAAALQLAGALRRFWAMRGYVQEGRRWLEEILARAPTAPAALRARALAGAAELAFRHGEFARGATYGEESLAAYRANGDLAGCALAVVALAWLETEPSRAQARGEEALVLARQAGSALAMARALAVLGNAAIGHCDLVQAQRYLEDGLLIGRTLGDRVSLIQLVGDLGQVAMLQGSYERAKALYQETLALERAVGDRFGLSATLHRLAQTEFCLGDPASAEALLEESVRLCRDLGHREQLIQALGTSGWLAWHQGDLSRAAAYLEEGMSVAVEIGKKALAATHLTWLLGRVALGRGEHRRALRLYREALATQYERVLQYRLLSLEGLAVTLGALGQAAEAAWLLGSSAAAREVLGMPMRPLDRAACDRSIAVMRSALGEDAWTAAWAAGRATPLEAAIAEAFEAGRAS